MPHLKSCCYYHWRVCEAWGGNSGEEREREEWRGEREGGRQRGRKEREEIIKMITHPNECKNSDLIYFGGAINQFCLVMFTNNWILRQCTYDDATHNTH